MVRVSIYSNPPSEKMKDKKVKNNSPVCICVFCLHVSSVEVTHQFQKDLHIFELKIQNLKVSVQIVKL